MRWKETPRTPETPGSPKRSANYSWPTSRDGSLFFALFASQFVLLGDLGDSGVSSTIDFLIRKAKHRKITASAVVAREVLYGEAECEI